jgi:hypothetical protein
MMAEKAIIFSAEMLRAIREGQKTMTRRVIKPQPQAKVLPISGDKPAVKLHDGHWYACDHKDSSSHDTPYRLMKHQFNAGDILYVKETWSKVPATAYRHSREEDGSKVPHRVSPCGVYWAVYKDGWDRSAPSWGSPRFMPKWASRLSLRVVSVRVERVNEITNEDAIREGVPHGSDLPMCLDDCRTAYSRFRDLWESINGKGSWAKNDYVWVIEFEVVN